MTLSKLTRSKSLQGKSSYELAVTIDGENKKVVHVDIDSMDKTILLVPEGQQAGPKPPVQETKKEGWDPETDLIDPEGNYVLF